MKPLKIDLYPNCFDCIFLKNVDGRNICSHKNAVIFNRIKKDCENCGRKVGVNSGGCGGCLGRGNYCYPRVYDICDCGGFKLLIKK